MKLLPRISSFAMALALVAGALLVSFALPTPVRAQGERAQRRDVLKQEAEALAVTASAACWRHLALKKGDEDFGNTHGFRLKT